MIKTLIKMWKCSLLLLCALAVVATCNEDWRYVNITQGPLRGRMDPEGGVYEFYNIPYATAPTGTDRFKAPRAPPIWWSMFDAVDRRIACPQALHVLPYPLNIQEDCLVANVYVPDTEETNLPVLVDIHGGAFLSFHSNYYEFKSLVRSNKIIAVNFNYRLGVHGFLCLGTEGVPGNAALKDQVALLRWVKKNIASFGGNPDDVTLTACSAGSAAVDALTLSSLTTGLFKKAIMEGGVSTGAVGLQNDPIENAKTYARLLNFNDVDDLNSLEEFYKTASFELITSQHDSMIRNVEILLSPCVERDIGQERVIVDAPLNVIKQGNYTKVPLLYGTTTMEGLMKLPFFERDSPGMNERFSDYLPVELYFENEGIKEEVAQKVKEYYFGDEPVSEDNIVSYVDYFTDIAIAYPMLNALSARVGSLGDTIYMYEYSFVDENTPPIPNTNIRAAGHCDQTVAVIDQDTTNMTEEYRQIKNTTREYWLNFILTESPSGNNSSLPPWPPANAQRSPYMSVGREIRLEHVHSLEDRLAFWSNIYEQYYRGSIVPDATTGGAVSHMTSNVMIVALLVSFYFKLLEQFL